MESLSETVSLFGRAAAAGDNANSPLPRGSSEISKLLTVLAPVQTDL